jgi:uncharacterized protein
MIHKFKMHGTNIVVDVYSGAVHILDDLVFELLDYYKVESLEQIENRLSDRYKISDIKEAYEEISDLIKDELLYTEDTYADMAKNNNKKSVIKAACFHISHDCNLRCTYCFAGTGNFGGERLNMPFEVGRDAIDFLIKNSGNRKNIEVDFFGGEPLMNFSVVREIVDYAREVEVRNNKNFRFTITTNALLLDDEKIEYINKHMYNVVLSIDGRPEVNDLMRKRVDGTGSYGKVLEKIKKLVDARNHQNYYVRGTFTRNNLDFSKDIFHLADMGFENISVEPVVACKDSGYEIRLEDVDTLLAEYENLAESYVKRRNEGKGFNFFHFMIDLSQGPCVSKRLSGCGSGHEYVSVTPEGDIYPCHQFVGIPGFIMGNVKEGELDRNIQSNFGKCNVYTRKECVECWAKFYCSGGCAANSYQFNKDINSVYDIACVLERKRVECSLWIKSME